MKFQSGIRCFWNLCKDLICLTAFRNPRMLRRGKEKGFTIRELKVAKDDVYKRDFSERIGHLCFCLIVQKRKRVIRRLYGKDCTFALQKFSFLSDL